MTQNSSQNNAQNAPEKGNERLEGRIEKLFSELQRPALITFLTAGDPDFEKSLKVLSSLPEAGADIIELGMPFTDPMADGPVIQDASIRALKNGADMKQTLEIVKEFRKHNKTTPIVLMGYYNPVLAYGVQEFVKDISSFGVDGLILVDLPPEESEELTGYLANTQVDFIRLITPTTDEARLEKILAGGASGFLYYVSITGVTGAAKQIGIEEIKAKIDIIKKHTDLPVAIGFGIKTAQDVKKFSGLADGVVVGSSLVETLQKNSNNNDLDKIMQEKVSQLAQGIT